MSTETNQPPTVDVRAHGGQLGTMTDPYRGTEDLPPVLPNPREEGWIKRAPGDVIEAGTPYVIRTRADDRAVIVRPDGPAFDTTADEYADWWTPPPAPSEPWSSISTDRDKPTDAYVNGVPGRYWRSGRALWMIAEDGNHYCLPDLSAGTDVELLHTHNPETHVPVERALIDEAVRWVHWLDTSPGDVQRPAGVRHVAEIVRALAALADGAES